MLPDIDWQALGLPNNGWYHHDSDHAYRVIKLLAKEIASKGFGFIEPAQSLKESWQRHAVKLGIRLYSPEDWNDFWRNVAYHIIADHYSPRAAAVAEEVRKVMTTTKPAAPFWRRARYLKWASLSVEELGRFARLLTIVLARVATEADVNHIDRPSWFRETENLKEALLEAQYYDVGKPEAEHLTKTDGVGYSVWLTEGECTHVVLVKDEDPDGLVYINERGVTAQHARQLALVLLEAANLAEKHS